MITTNFNLKHFLSEADGNIMDVCATVYIDYLKKLKESEPSNIEEGSNLLRVFLEWRGETDNLESDPTVFPTEECDKIIGKIYKVIDSIVTNMICFFAMIWKRASRFCVCLPTLKHRIISSERDLVWMMMNTVVFLIDM